MPKLKPQKALSKLQEYIDETNRLSRMKYDEGENGKFKLNENIRSLIRYTFDNADEKLRDYDGTVNGLIVVAGVKKTEKEEQEDYLDSLSNMKNLLETYQEELKMLLEHSQADIKDERRSNEVFIIHGHNTVALLETKDLLKDRWGINSIILKKRPAKGRTLIEKFEQEAQKASYAFAILTPDDMVRSANKRYHQPRPNVVFELGWFYGKLGREKVCILYKKGTAIHSDLQGISHIEFYKSVMEKVSEIEDELKAGNLL